MQRRRDCLGEHGIAGARRADHEHASLALAARLDEQPAVLDEPEDLSHLADRRLLAADVVHAHPEIGVVGVDHGFADSRVEIERAEEEHEVGAEQEEQIDQLCEDELQELRERGQRVFRQQVEKEVSQAEIHDRQHRDVDRPPPENGAVGFDRALEHVRLWHEPFANYQPAARDAEQPAEEQHRHDRVDERPADSELEVNVGKCKRGRSDEEGEDPEDDHGALSPYTA